MYRIDTERWARKDVYRFFSANPHPFFSVTFTIDVSNVYRYTKANGVSFYMAMIWLTTTAMNRLEAFRTVIRDGEVWVLDERVPSFTDLHPGADQYHLVALPVGADMAAFCRAAKAKSNAQTDFITPESVGDSLLYFTCVPWIEMTGLTTLHSDDVNDTTPRLSWGKYVTDAEGRKKLNICLEINHRVADGLHVGRFMHELEALIAGLEN